MATRQGCRGVSPTVFSVAKGAVSTNRFDGTSHILLHRGGSPTVSIVHDMMNVNLAGIDLHSHSTSTNPPQGMISTLVMQKRFMCLVVKERRASSFQRIGVAPSFRRKIPMTQNGGPS
jgi:hypothetical protein